MSLNPEDKVIRQRVSVLELAEALDNVSEACRQRGISRSQYYEYKKRFAVAGIAGLKDLPPIHHSHPDATPPEQVERILALSLEHPAWGCNKLSEWLKLEGIRISFVTIQNILNKHDLGTRYARWLRLEQEYSQTALELTPEQVRFVEKQNPAFRERHIESSGPGELLAQDTVTIGSIKGVGRIYLHVVVDTYSSYAFGFLHTSKQPEAAVAVLHNDVLPFYADHQLSVQAVLTDNGREFCGTELHPYELYLALNDLEHRKTRIRRPQSNGFVERFNGTVQSEFFDLAFRTKFYTTVAELQTDLDQWLVHYNTERPHQGYRNQGRRPHDTILEFLKQQPQRQLAAASPSARHDP